MQLDDQDTTTQNTKPTVNNNEHTEEDNNDDDDDDAASEIMYDEDDENDVTEELRCSLCDDVFTSETQLMTHRRRWHPRGTTRSGREPSTCPVCGKTFKNKPSLSAHVSLQHRRKVREPSTCPVCGKTFKPSLSARQSTAQEEGKRTQHLPRVW